MVSADGLVAVAGAVAGQNESCAVGSMDASALERLAAFVAERDESTLRQQLQELGISDERFCANFLRSCSDCRRGALLYPSSAGLAISFNGGKDACVVLYLWLAAVAATSSGERELPKVVFFDSAEEFQEVQCFVNWLVQSLGLPMATIQGLSFRGGMEDLVARGVRAMVMGQRRTDPWMAGMTVYSPSSDGWPAFMRINPILDWSYADVWTFLRAFGLPYCRLYDEGYTSLGSVKDTLPNPALRRQDGSFAPAWELEDASLERSGRTKSSGGEAKPPVKRHWPAGNAPVAGVAVP